MSDHIHIVSIEVENFRRITAAAIELSETAGLVRVTGPNQAGKTSLLKAIAGVLGGTSSVHLDSLHEGAKTGKVTVKLTNGFTIERRTTVKAPKGYLTITGPDGGRHTQGRLADWIGPRSFDPLAFLALTTPAKRDVLFSIAKDPELPSKLAASREDYGVHYDKRTPLISKRRELSHRIANGPEGRIPKSIDTDAALAELRELEEKGRQCHAAGRAATIAERERIAGESRMAREEARCSHQKAVIRDLSQQVKVARRILGEYKEELARVAEEQKELDGRSVARNRAFEELDDPSAAIKAVQERLASAVEVELQRGPWVRHAEAMEELEDVKMKEARLTDGIKAIKAAEGRLLKESGIPIEGLGFDDSGAPLLNGLSLEVASGRERIEVAVRVALAADPKIRVCLLDEANDLDLEALAGLEQLAIENDFQIWCVRIGLEGPGEIVVEDGVAMTPKEEESEET